MTHLVGLVHSGDSIAGNNANAYFFQAWGWTGRGDQTAPATQAIATYYATNLIARNMGIGGTRLNSNGFPDLVPMAPGWIDTIIPTSYAVPPFGRTRRYIFTTAIGHNDTCVGSYGPGNPGPYAADVATCCVARKSAGFNLAGICTILPATGVSGQAETDRLAYNALIISSSWRVAHGIDFAIDLASETTMGNPANCTNATYYLQDGVPGVHPTTTGHGLLAPIYKAAIDAAILTL
jgi:hypothetical protein